MDAEEFRRHGYKMIDYVADYLENIRDRPVCPSVEPGYIKKLIPDRAPDDPEDFNEVFKDIERVIMPGITHWHHPNFHAYFPTASSYPAMIADILCGGIGCIGFTWASSPACTELEMVVMDWLGKMLKLPTEFLTAGSEGRGGGVIQGTASEATLVSLLGAKARATRKVREQHPDWTDHVIQSKLVAYCSEQAHSSVERAGLLAGIRMRLLKPEDEPLCLKGAPLKRAMDEDAAKGLIPFYVVATLGTTNTCAYDDLQSLGEVCVKRDIWMHVDAAYAGASFICPEYRHYLDGVEFAESFNFNPHKWMLVNFDCSAMWIKNKDDLVDAFNVDPLYLKHQNQGAVPDYRHWQIPLGRRFRSLKLWFVLRSYGVKGLQEHIRNQIVLAHDFETMINNDSRFEISFPVTLGLVCFRVKGSNDLNKELLKRINDSGKVHLVPCNIGGSFILRFAVCSRITTLDDIKFSWKQIQRYAEQALAEEKAKK